jgi:hypothetical protein
MNMVDELANNVAAGAAITFAEILEGNVHLANELAPRESRYALMDPQGTADLLTDTKGLFQDATEIGKQYKEGMMGRHAGYDFFENTLLPSHTTGTEGGGSAYDTNQVAAQVGSYTSPNSMGLIIDTGTKTITEGSVFTIATVNAVHPESKSDLGVLREFTVLADATGAGTIQISPAIIAAGPYQNCTVGAPDNTALVFAGAASTAYKQSLLFQKGFAVFGTADLVMPPNTTGARVVQDGISMRMIHNEYDVVKDRMYTRLDVLYGYKVLRPGLACKVRHT